jgi:hypothetical protein
MGKNQAYKAMQRARLGSGSGGPDEVEDGMVCTLSYYYSLLNLSFFMFHSNSNMLIWFCYVKYLNFMLVVVCLVFIKLIFGCKNFLLKLCLLRFVI